MPDYIVQIIYFVSVLLCVFGLKKISTTKSNKQGVTLIGVGIVIAVITTFFSSALIVVQLKLFSLIFVTKPCCVAFVASAACTKRKC